MHAPIFFSSRLTVPLCRLLSSRMADIAALTQQGFSETTSRAKARSCNSLLGLAFFALLRQRLLLVAPFSSLLTRSLAVLALLLGLRLFFHSLLLGLLGALALLRQRLLLFPLPLLLLLVRILNPARLLPLRRLWRVVAKSAALAGCERLWRRDAVVRPNDGLDLSNGDLRDTSF